MELVQASIHRKGVWIIFSIDNSISIVSGTTVKPLLTNPQRIKDTIEKTSIIRTKILVPTGINNTFLTSERGNPLYYSKNIWSQSVRYREILLYRSKNKVGWQEILM